MTKILLVEDNEMNRDMLARRLEKKGFAVVHSADGQDGVKVAQDERPDLILMDIGLPIIDGLEATRILRQETETRHIPIIALTAHAMSGDRERCLKAGCNDYATKPVEFTQLIKKIKRLVPEV